MSTWMMRATEQRNELGGDQDTQQEGVPTQWILVQKSSSPYTDLVIIETNEKPPRDPSEFL